MDDPQKPQAEVTPESPATEAGGAGAKGNEAAPASVDATGGGGSGGSTGVPAQTGAGGGGGSVAAGGAGSGGGAGGGQGLGAGTGAGGSGFQVLNLQTAQASQVTDAQVVATEVKPSPTMAIGKLLTLWVLAILALSILLLVAYLWHMERVTGDDVRRNYGKDLNRDDVALYMAGRMQRLLNGLNAAQSDPKYAASKGEIADDQALSDVISTLPDITDQQRAQLKSCVALIGAPQAEASSSKQPAPDRKTQLQPCIDFLEKTKSEGMNAAAAAMTFQMASEASAKLLEERTSLHDFWIKAAQLILLNLLLPVLTAIIGYTFGNNQAQQQSSGSSSN